MMMMMEPHPHPHLNHLQHHFLEPLELDCATSSSCSSSSSSSSSSLSSSGCSVASSSSSSSLSSCSLMMLGSTASSTCSTSTTQSALGGPRLGAHQMRRLLLQQQSALETGSDSGIDSNCKENQPGSGGGSHSSLGYVSLSGYRSVTPNRSSPAGCMSPDQIGHLHLLRTTALSQAHHSTSGSGSGSGILTTMASTAPATTTAVHSAANGTPGDQKKNLDADSLLARLARVRPASAIGHSQMVGRHQTTYHEPRNRHQQLSSKKAAEAVLAAAAAAAAAASNLGQQHGGSIDDMPMLKRALQAPPLINTNMLMDEAYRHHKKFRAAQRSSSNGKQQSPTNADGSERQQLASSPAPSSSGSVSGSSSPIGGAGANRSHNHHPDGHDTPAIDEAAPDSKEQRPDSSGVQLRQRSGSQLAHLHSTLLGRLQRPPPSSLPHMSQRQLSQCNDLIQEIILRDEQRSLSGPQQQQQQPAQWAAELNWRSPIPSGALAPASSPVSTSSQVAPMEPGEQQQQQQRRSEPTSNEHKSDRPSSVSPSSSLSILSPSPSSSVSPDLPAPSERAAYLPDPSQLLDSSGPTSSYQYIDQHLSYHRAEQQPTTQASGLNLTVAASTPNDTTSGSVFGLPRLQSALRPDTIPASMGNHRLLAVRSPVSPLDSCDALTNQSSLCGLTLGLGLSSASASPTSPRLGPGSAARAINCQLAANQLNHISRLSLHCPSSAQAEDNSYLMGPLLETHNHHHQQLLVRTDKNKGGFGLLADVALAAAAAEAAALEQKDRQRQQQQQQQQTEQLMMIGANSSPLSASSGQTCGSALAGSCSSIGRLIEQNMSSSAALQPIDLSKK